ncbi:SpoIIIAH-like family protein [Aquibacillus albus]|uniref:Stage III sporulation protein AH n=1 Tax=Aquibacillus albus TaxID=1168171 RepID=A0ABS2MUZ1_9BACI|nr:SpoIIIAH-like family protein [Aquibacillus albus]MBM7569702.1 stage III sporulation protein AH [Aquibacillus albus]
MLKKQTVWLLTMLSLMIVLSVYYMSSPNGEDLAYMNQNEAESNEAATSDLGETEQMMEGEEMDVEGMMEGEEQEVISSTSTDELFTTIRMELNDQRSRRLDQLDDIVASSTASTEEKNKAYDEMKEIESTSTKETILEETIEAENGYPDVLVRTVDGNVVVTVKANELSQTEANNIMKLVSDEFGPVEVEVKYQPVNE